jgi:hypothetical protein
MKTPRWMQHKNLSDFNIKKILFDLSIENKDLYYKLTIIFAFFFLVPLFGFGLFASKYEILGDESIPFFLVALLTSSFFGYILIRKVFDEIKAASKQI